MKTMKFAGIIIVLILLISVSACSENNESRVISKEPGGTITVIDNDDKEKQEPMITVEKIERLENVEITDWFDEETVIVSKDNDVLGKITLTELQDTHPKSLYYYDINTKEYELIIEKKDVLLQGATVSADNKYLLYGEYVLGDPAYYVTNLDTKETFCLQGNEIDFAKSAIWYGDEIIGTSYKNGAYIAKVSGDISVLEGIEGESAFILRPTRNNIYYNTAEDASLIQMDRRTGDKMKLNIDHVFDLTISEDETKMLLLQSESTKNVLLLLDLESGDQVKITEGSTIGGISWSSDNRMIAYNVKSSGTNTAINGLYVYDILTAKSTQIAVDVQNAFTIWSPSGDKLMYTQWNGDSYDSSIVYLKCLF